MTKILEELHCNLKLPYLHAGVVVSSMGGQSRSLLRPNDISGCVDSVCEIGDDHGHDGRPVESQAKSFHLKQCYQNVRQRIIQSHLTL